MLGVEEGGDLLDGVAVEGPHAGAREARGDHAVCDLAHVDSVWYGWRIYQIVYVMFLLIMRNMKTYISEVKVKAILLVAPLVLRDELPDAGLEVLLLGVDLPHSDNSDEPEDREQREPLHPGVAVQRHAGDDEGAEHDDEVYWQTCKQCWTIGEARL